MYYRVFIKYCFWKILNIPNACLSLFSLGVGVCTHSRQVENQRCSRTGRVEKNHKIFRKKHNNEHLVDVILQHGTAKSASMVDDYNVYRSFKGNLKNAPTNRNSIAPPWFSAIEKS